MPLANFMSHRFIRLPLREVSVSSVCLMRETTVESDQGEIPLLINFIALQNLRSLKEAGNSILEEHWNIREAICCCNHINLGSSSSSEKLHHG